MHVLKNEYMEMAKKIKKETFLQLKEIADKVGISAEALGAIWMAINQNLGMNSSPQNVFVKRGYAKEIKYLTGIFCEETLVEAVTYAGSWCRSPYELHRSIFEEYNIHESDEYEELAACFE